MGLDFSSNDAEETAIRAPKGVALVLALVAAALAGLFLFGASSTGAVEPDERARLSIPLSIPWDGSALFVNGSGETRTAALSCYWSDRGVVAPWEALSVPSIVTSDQSWCVVHARLSSAQDLSVQSDHFTWCERDVCYFHLRPGEHAELTMKPPVDRNEPRRDLSAPYLSYFGDWRNPQLPGVTYHDILERAWPYMSVAIDPSSLEIIDGPEYADAWTTGDGRIAVETDKSTDVPIDEFRYRLCGIDGRCAEQDVSVYYAQAPNPVDGTWRVPAEANPGIGRLNHSDPNHVPFGWTRLHDIEIVDAPDFGVVSVINYGREFAYYPEAGFKGVDSFTYKACDVQGLCGEATVTLLVGGAEDPSGEPTPEPGPTPKPDPKDDGKLTDDQLKEIALKKLAEQDGPLTEDQLKKLALEKLTEEGGKLTADELKEIAFKKLADDERFDDPRIGLIIDDLLTALPSAGTPTDEPVEVDPKLADCTIIGTEGDDVLVGTSGPDVICGLGGDDIIHGKGGNDILRGGPGDDQLNGGAGRDHLYGGDGRDELLGKRGADRLRGGKGPDELRGGKGADRMWGNAGEDVLRGNAGADRMRGGKGDDIILGGAGKDSAWGGKGADRIWGGKGDDNLRGNAGKDVLFGNAGKDKLVGGAGNDLVGADNKIR